MRPRNRATGTPLHYNLLHRSKGAPNMSRRRTLQSILVLLFPIITTAQVPTIINEIGELEGVRDPKCYATASRLADFIYATPLEPEAQVPTIINEIGELEGVRDPK